MFTGIIERKGSIKSVNGSTIRRIVIEKPASWKLPIGGSVAVDGVCVTVISQTKTTFSCDIMPETIARSTMNSVSAGKCVNLERPLKLGDELGGHLVLGHVDGRGIVTILTDRGASREIGIATSAALARFIVEKGSVTVNGVSLTVAHKRGKTFTVALIPHTLKMTNLGALEKGDEVNIEIDNLRRSLAALRKK